MTESIMKISNSGDDRFAECITEATNFHVKIPAELQATAAAEFLSIADRKKQLNKANDVAPPLANGGGQSEAASLKLESNVSKDEAKTEPMKNKLMEATAEKTSLAVPELARLKHRPLSATSICSTSSSSSSGSETLMANKLGGISYLASVESLADHSENEQPAHGALTLCERACMEIIDSEKSYVADLGQVIKG